MVYISLKYLILILLIIGFFFFLNSCESHRRERVSLNIEKIKLDNDFRINKIIFINKDLGFLCGGNKNNNGYIYKTTDGGNSWQLKYRCDSLSIRDIYYVSDSLILACGDSMLLLNSFNTGESWQVFKFANFPYEAYKVPYNAVYAKDLKKIVLAGGEHFEKGLLSKTETGNYPWVHDSYDNQFNSLHFVNEYFGIICGYGIVLLTEDGGNTYSFVDLGADDFVDVEFVNGEVYILGSSGIIYKSSDLGYNCIKEINLILKGYNDLSIGEEFKIAVGLGGKAFLKYNNDLNWMEISNMPKQDYYTCFIREDNVVFIGSDKGEIVVLNRGRDR